MYHFAQVTGRCHFTITHLGEKLDVYHIGNPINSLDLSHLLGKVTIDGVEREVIGVERNAHMPPYHRGESVGLVCRKLQPRS